MTFFGSHKRNFGPFQFWTFVAGYVCGFSISEYSITCYYVVFINCPIVCLQPDELMDLMLLWMSQKFPSHRKDVIFSISTGHFMECARNRYIHCLIKRSGKVVTTFFQKRD